LVHCRVQHGDSLTRAQLDASVHGEALVQRAAAARLALVEAVAELDEQLADV
jgi:hypothetical protein